MNIRIIPSDDSIPSLNPHQRIAIVSYDGENDLWALGDDPDALDELSLYYQDTYGGGPDKIQVYRIE